MKIEIIKCDICEVEQRSDKDNGQYDTALKFTKTQLIKYETESVNDGVVYLSGDICDSCKVSLVEVLTDIKEIVIKQKGE